MKTIKALRQFSHYHEGNFSEGDVREVPDDVATALVDMGLAEEAGAGSESSTGSSSATEGQPPAGKPPSDGLNVAQIKEALAARGIAIPEGVTLKADLAKLLDDAPTA